MSAGQADLAEVQRAMTLKGKQMFYYDIINHDDREKVSATKLK